MLDATHVRAHQQAATGKGAAKKGARTRLWGSRGGLMTKIRLLADALGRPLRFLLTAGEVHESRTAAAMLDGVEGDAVIADKAYDSNAIREDGRGRRHDGGDPVAAKPQDEYPARPGALPRPQPHRAMLPQAEALSTPRHPL
jgi:transposase